MNADALHHDEPLAAAARLGSTALLRRCGTARRLFAICFATLACSVGFAADRQPSGANCRITAPPADAGEEGSHGYVVLVFPRTGSIGATYTGCQAVFVADQTHAPRLAWVIEISAGDPVRMWSADDDLSYVLPCRYKERRLREGDPAVCPRAESLLVPTQPAGCFTGSREGQVCRYDVE